MLPSKRFTWSMVVIYALLILGGIVVFYPFFYMLMNSVKTGPEILHSPPACPARSPSRVIRGFSSG